jgi:heat shock protein HslJ
MKNTFAALVLAAIVAPASAFAATSQVSFSAATLSPDEPEAGQQVTLTVIGDKTSSSGGCTNNWGYTKVYVDGNLEGQTTLNSFTGSGTVSDSITFGAGNSGDKSVLIEIWSGEEDFAPADGIADCADELLDSTTLTLEVKAPAVSGPSTKAVSTISGGGGFTYCDLNTEPSENIRDIHMCTDRATGKVVPTLVWRGGGLFGSYSAIESIKQQLLGIWAILQSM